MHVLLACGVIIKLFSAVFSIVDFILFIVLYVHAIAILF